jgi:tetratricopeptide (TPR) repeat protein
MGGEGHLFRSFHHRTTMPRTNRNHPLETIETVVGHNSNRRRCVSWNSALDLQTKDGPEEEMYLEVQLLHCIALYGRDHPATCRLFNKVGNAHFRRGHFDMAARYYETAAFLLCESEPEHVVALLNLGTVYWRTHQLDRAMATLQQAQRACHDEPQPLVKASVYHQLGLCYALLHEYPRATKALTRAYQIRVGWFGENHHWSIGKTLDAMARVHGMQREFDAAAIPGRARTMAQEPTRETVEAMRNLAAGFQAAGRPPDQLESLWKQQQQQQPVDPLMSE